MDQAQADRRHAEHMRRAIELARRSIGAGGGPFGAVVVRAGAVVAEGSNNVVPGHDPTAHAEVVAIRRACSALGSHVLEGCVIYSSCEPCPMCLAAIHWARIDAVHFAADRLDAARAGFDDELLYRRFAAAGPDSPGTAPSTPANAAARSAPCHPLLADEGRAVFSEWAAHAGKTPY